MTDAVFTASTTTARQLAQLQRRPYPASRTSAASYTIASRPSFDLRIERDDGVWTVTDEASGIFGTGASPEDALLDFRLAAREHLDVLERSDALAPGLQEQLEYLRARVRPAA